MVCASNAYVTVYEVWIVDATSRAVLHGRTHIQAVRHVHPSSRGNESAGNLKQIVMTMKRKHSDDSPRDSPSEPTIYRSAPIEDRDSTFIGLYSPDLGPKELQKLTELKSASHRMLAWRRESNQQSLTSSKQYVTGNDDDGEKYGGRKVENVLIRTKVTGACVVARWYGGTMLGQARFVHIENCANEAVRQWLDHVGEQHAKKRKIEDDKVEKEKLAKALAARDQSIIVLRTLATEKEKMAREAVEEKPHAAGDVNGKAIIVDATRDKTPSPPRSNPGVQPAGPDYDAMSVERLRALDKARDATLAFLLKRINKAESDLARIAREKASEEKEQQDSKPTEAISNS
jgi:putative IMPACT (imprinted ancient) family translation regulator